MYVNNHGGLGFVSFHERVTRGRCQVVKAKRWMILILMAVLALLDSSRMALNIIARGM